MRAKPSRSKTVLLSLLVCGGLTGCPGDPAEDLDHGFVEIELKRGQSETSSPYDGTSRIEVTLLYLECLIDFYEMNPDYQQFGPEGAMVFGTAEDGGEGWVDRLCEDRGAGQVDCTVESFRQELEAAKQLTIAYSVSGPIEDHVLPFGPLPEEELAGCVPIVRVGGMGAVRGLDGSGTVVWNTEAFDPSDAATGQGQPITIRASRAGN